MKLGIFIKKSAVFVNNVLRPGNMKKQYAEKLPTTTLSFLSQNCFCNLSFEFFFFVGGGGGHWVKYSNLLPCFRIAPPSISQQRRK